MNNFHNPCSQYNDDLNMAQAPASAGETPDTGMIQAPQTGTQAPDIGMIPIPPNVQPPDTGMIQAPPSGTQTPDTGMIPIPPFAQQPPSTPNQILFLLQRCMNNMMYVRTRNGDGFWFYPFDIYQGTVNGYRWNARAGWFVYSVPIASIHDAYCYSY